MTVRTQPATHPQAAAIEHDLLARLGLTTDASSQEVEAAHDGLVEYLERAPHDLHGWAQREIAAADEAYALLSDPTSDRAAPAAAVMASASARVKSATDEDSFGELDTEPATRTARRESERSAHAAAKRKAANQPAGSGRGRLVKRVAIGAAAIVGVVAIALGGYNLGGGTGVPPISGTPAPEASAAARVDKARVAELMKKIEANPNDVASLQELGDTFYQVGDFETAGAWMERILAVDPKNLPARLALGAVLFNLGKSADAEKQWRQALVLDPKNVEAHYDLGFLYLNQSPPDIAKVKVEWSEVVRIAPDSDVAKTISVHLKSLDASPAPRGAASSEPAASPAASGN